MTVLLVLNVAATVDRMIFAALATAIQPALRLTNPQMGVIQGPAFAFPYAAALPLAGWLADRLQAQRVLTGSVAIWTAGLALCATASGFVPLVAGRALCGLGQSALAPVAFGAIGASIRPDRIGRAIAVFTGAGTLGRSIAFAVGGMLLGWFSARGVEDAWSAALGVLCAANLALVGAVLVIAPPSVQARNRASHRGAAASGPGLGALARGAPGTVAATVAAALGPVIVAQAVTGWAAMALMHTYRLPPSHIAGLIAVAVLTAPVGHMTGGWLMDRADGRRSAGLSQAALAVLCVPATMALAWSGTLAVALAGLAALMLFAGAGAVAGLERVQRLAPPATRGSVNGTFLLLAATVGTGGGPLAVGLIAGPGGVSAALVEVVAAAATITVAGALIGVSRRNRTEVGGR